MKGWLAMDRNRVVDPGFDSVTGQQPLKLVPFARPNNVEMKDVAIRLVRGGGMKRFIE